MNLATIIFLVTSVPIFFMFGLGGSPDESQQLEKEYNTDPTMAKFNIPPSIQVKFSKNETTADTYEQLNVINPLESPVYLKFDPERSYSPYIFFDRDNDMIQIEAGAMKTVYFTAVINDGDSVKEYRRDTKIMVFKKEEDGEFNILKIYTVPTYLEITE